MGRKIFLSYRRTDSGAEARSICQYLQKKFGKKGIFIDVDAIHPGKDFRAVLNDHLEQCRVLVVVIGPTWVERLSAADISAKHASEDYVRLEIISALDRHIPIIPVLVDGAQMPTESDLPAELTALAFRQAFAVRHDSFPRDMTSLEQELRRLIPVATEPTVLLAATLSVVCLGLALLLYWFPVLASSRLYERDGNFACYNQAEYPESWRQEASMCVNYGCNFGRLPRADCLALATRKSSKIVIHGNPDTTRENECWLQHSCEDLRRHGEFTLFRMKTKDAVIN